MKFLISQIGKRMILKNLKNNNRLMNRKKIMKKMMLINYSMRIFLLDKKLQTKKLNIFFLLKK